MNDSEHGLPAIGQKAPDFKLASGVDTTLSLSELKGSPAVLVFYPADWSPVCGDQLGLYNEIIDEFNRFGAKLVGISVDGAWCHKAYKSQRKLEFPLLADFEPKGEVSRKFGVYAEDLGVCERALFVLDKEGIVRWRHISPAAVNPGADGILSALEALEAKEAGHAHH